MKPSGDLTAIPYDIWTQVALRLPAVKSNTPWRDVNSLASTCKHLYRWKKSDLTNRLKQERKDAMNLASTLDDPHAVLQKILDVPAGSMSRLLREPVLRATFNRHQAGPGRLKVPNKSRDFLLTLYANRESASFEEIKHCFQVLGVTKDAKGMDLCRVLLSLLTTLNGDDRLKGIRLMFGWIDKNLPAREVIWDDKTFSNIHAALGEDQASKAVLELGLAARKLLPYKLNLHEAAYSLSWIPENRRWNWMATNVPEFIKTRLGMMVSLSDPVCAPQLISESIKYFSEEKVNANMFLQCARLLMLHQQFEENPKGKKLLKKVCRRLMQIPEGIGSADRNLYSSYKVAVKQFIRLQKQYLKYGERQNLYFHLFRVAGEAIESALTVRFTEMLQLAAQGNPQPSYIYKHAVRIQIEKSKELSDTFHYALSRFTDLPNRHHQGYYISILLGMAKTALARDPSAYEAFKANALVIRKTTT